MKKFAAVLCIFLLFPFLISGCGKPKTESDIRKIAYQTLSKSDRKQVSDWENAKVEMIRFSEDHYVDASGRSVNIKNKPAYRVTFHIVNEGMLGPIAVYIDKNTDRLLGQDLRD